MLSNALGFAITPQQVDKSDITQGDIYEELEQISNAITPDLNLDFVHADEWEHALEDAKAFNAVQIERLYTALAQGQRLLEAKKTLKRKGEFTKFRNSLLVTLSQARQYMALATIFGDWAINKLVQIASATNIYTLTQKKYAPVVEHLCHAESVTREYVQQLLKEFRARVSVKRQKAQVSSDEPAARVLEQHIDPSGGFYYTLNKVNLSEDIGSKLQVELENKSIGQVLATALNPSDTKFEVEQLRQQLRDAIDEMRDHHIEMQRQIIRQDEQLKEKDERIKTLETELSVALSFRKKHIATVQQVRNAPPRSVPWQPLALSSAVELPRTSLEDFDNWEEFADYVNCDRDQLMKVVQSRPTSERQHLSKILSQFLAAEPHNFNTIDWLPENLVATACRYLSFSVERLSGGENLVDEPTIETILGCKFISLRDFGTKRECWVFQLPDRKHVPIFGREQFQVERSSVATAIALVQDPY